MPISKMRIAHVDSWIWGGGGVGKCEFSGPITNSTEADYDLKLPSQLNGKLFYNTTVLESCQDTRSLHQEYTSVVIQIHSTQLVHHDTPMTKPLQWHTHQVSRRDTGCLL